MPNISRPRQVLALLSTKSGWEKYRGAIPDSFFLEGLRDIYDLIEKFWSLAGPEIGGISRGAMAHLVESKGGSPEDQAKLIRLFQECLDALPASEEEEPAIRASIFKSRANETIVKAATDLSRERLIPSEYVERFEGLDILKRSEKKEDPLDPLDIVSIVEEEKRKKVYPTGISEVDRVLNGGLWTGELGLILAPTFIGKTSFLVHLGVQSLLNGIRVFHISTEVSKRRLLIRYYQSLLRKERREILFQPQETKKKLEKLELPKWRVEDYSEGGVNTGTIASEARRFFEPKEEGGLLLVDHLELGAIRPRNENLEGRFALGEAAEELRQVGVTCNCGVWTAQQANRPSYGGKRVKLENAAESIGPPRKSDVVLTLSQDDEERRQSTMRIGIDKARERTITQKLVHVIAELEVQRFRSIE